MGVVAGLRGGDAYGKPIRGTGFNDLLWFGESAIMELWGNTPDVQEEDIN